LLPENDAAVIWRGPKKTALIRQFLSDVIWGGIEYLVIDTPPGTSDEHLAVLDAIKQHISQDRDQDSTSNSNSTEPVDYGAIIVTTPQGVSISDVRKEIGFCKKMQIPIYGLIENMAGFVCPNCKECSYIFSSDGGKQLATESQINYLGSIPLDPSLTLLSDAGSNQSFLQLYPQSETVQSIKTFVNAVLNIDNAKERA